MDSHPDEPPSRGAVDDEHVVGTGRRPSRQRVVVEDLLHRVEDFRSAQQLTGCCRLRVTAWD